VNSPAAACKAKPGTRADAQRDRILCAALKCFIEHGFHAASMASIADAAQMSAGLMYRYFANKNAIVLAIIERQLDEKRSVIRQLQSSTDMVARLVQTFEHWRSRDSQVMSAALFLEMSAEATRNPQVAEALRSSDALTRAEFQTWLSRSPGEGGLGLPAEAAASRALLLQCVIEGLALRAAREPDLHADQLRVTLNDLFTRLSS
jgi:AcrR family transcriptional regulator